MKAKEAALTYTPSAAIAYREIAGQVLVLLPDDPELRTFNASAAFIWKRLVRRTALPSIVDELAREFGIERVRAEADVLHFVRDMTRQGLLRKRRT
jgi:hypothetical protein